MFCFFLILLLVLKKTYIPITVALVSLNSIQHFNSMFCCVLNNEVCPQPFTMSFQQDLQKILLKQQKTFCHTCNLVEFHEYYPSTSVKAWTALKELD